MATAERDALERVEGRIARRLLGVILLTIGWVVAVAVAWGNLSADVRNLQIEVDKIERVQSATEKPLAEIQRTLDSLVIEVRVLRRDLNDSRGRR